MSIYNTNFITRFVRYSFEKVIDNTQNKDAVLLDLGCGVMPFRKIYSKYFSKTVAGDYERRLDDENIVVLDAQNLPFTDNSFNCILLTEVLEHLPEPDRCISEISRVMRDNGKLILTVPFLHHLHEIPYDHFRYTEFQLEKMLNKNGFKINVFKRRGNFFLINFSYLEYFIFLIITALKKIYILFPVYYLLNLLFVAFFTVIYDLIIAFQFSGKISISIGEKLIGRNTLNIFPMGYCLVAEKIKNE